MSNPEDKRLKELLGKKSTDQLDDFEREALEGFSLLDPASDAHTVKQELDARVKPLFEKPKSRRALVYWMAAAMLVIMGLSVYVMLSDASHLGQQNNLALLPPSPPPAADARPGFESEAAVLRSPTPAANPAPVVAAPRVQPVQPRAGAEPAAETTPAEVESPPAADLAMAESVKAVKVEKESDAPAPSAVFSAGAVEDARAENQVVAAKDRVVAKKAAAVSAEQHAAHSNRVDDKGKLVAACTYSAGADALQNELSKRLTGFDKGFEALVQITVSAGKMSYELLTTHGIKNNRKEEVLSVINALQPYCKENESCKCMLYFKPAN